MITCLAFSSDEAETSSDNQLAQSPDTAPPGLVNLLKHIQANADFYQVMLGNQGDLSFCAKSFRSYIEQGFGRMLSSETFQVDPSRPPVDLTVNYLRSAGVGAIVWWLEHDQPASPDTDGKLALPTQQGKH